MKLRTRLALAIVGLVAVALAGFGVATTRLYARSLAAQLDDELQANAQGQAGRLLAAAGREVIDPETCQAVGTDADADASTDLGPPPAGGGAAPGQGLDAYTEVRDADGTVVACALPVTSDGRPDLPDDLAVADGERAFLTVDSVDGGGRWRVLVVDLPGWPAGTPPADLVASPTGNDAPTFVANEQRTIVVAARTDGTAASLARLVQIEMGASLVLLSAVGVGAWLVLRRGLRPLEEMADTAGQITGGERGLRVDPADGRTEVGRLGLALNTMLDGIDHSFEERDATEAKLRQFLADASHELRTPLTSIQGYAELSRLAPDAARGPASGQDRDLALARIEVEAGRMRALVEDLLLLARLDEHVGIEPVPVDLAIVAAEACAVAAGLPGDHPLRLEATEPVVVRGVGDHLHRAVTNLLANAVRHTAEGTAVEVRVTADREQGRAAVMVRDHGPGLTRAGLAHAFDRFWQADVARAGRGTGLGLSIVASIVAEHRGTAEAANAPDGGAVFTLAFPLDDAAAEEEVALPAG